MAQKPSTGKIKKFFAKLGRHRDPDLSPNPSAPPSMNPTTPTPNPGAPPATNDSRLPPQNPTPASPNHSRPPSPKPSRPTSPTSAKPPTVHQAPQQHDLKDSAKTAWKATEMALRLLEKNADGFPPLKTAVGVLVTCLDLAKDVIGNQEEYVKLADEFKDMASTLAPHASKLAASESIALIIQSIDEELGEIKDKLERGKFKRVISAADDQGDILARYRKIDSLFRRLLSDIILRNYVEIGKLREATDAMLLRTLSPVDDARYNSAYSTVVKRRGCTASTREQILDDLRTWVKDPNGSKVFWINGMAGTGKTTILYSFCEWLEDKRLAGNFFCSRGSTACRDLNNIVRSIAYQLAHYSPAFRSELCKILEEKQNPHMLKVEEQFKWVVATPLEKSKDAIPDGAAIVIDALDECNNTSATASFLKVLLSYATDLPIKFLVSSRPEPVIVEKMQESHFSHSLLRLHEIEEPLVEADIRQYLQEAFSTMSPPPSLDDIDQLARRSGKLFIYAATVARYINPEGAKPLNPHKRLKMILGVSSPSAPSLHHKELDLLYMTILSSAFDKEILEDEDVRIVALVLRTVICALEPMTKSTMSTILALEQEYVVSSLSRLQSVLHVQEGPSGLVSVFHASFPDYLCDKARSCEFYCDIVEHNTKLAHSCFDVMYKELHFNMCDLESSYNFDEDVPDLEQKIKANISTGLLYACKHWGNHLVHCDFLDSLHNHLIEFLKLHFLFWMEVLHLTKTNSIGSQMLVNTLAWFIHKAPNHKFKETEKELYDACWKAVQTALRLLEKSVDACAPLKSTMDGLIACLDLTKNIIGNEEEYINLAFQFTGLASTFEPHALKLAASDAQGSIALILKSINEELAEINCQLERGRFKRIVKAADDQGDILTRYRKIDSLFLRLLSDITLRNNVEIVKDFELTP